LPLAYLPASCSGCSRSSRKSSVSLFSSVLPLLPSSANRLSAQESSCASSSSTLSSKLILFGVSQSLSSMKSPKRDSSSVFSGTKSASPGLKILRPLSSSSCSSSSSNRGVSSSKRASSSMTGSWRCSRALLASLLMLRTVLGLAADSSAALAAVLSSSQFSRALKMCRQEPQRTAPAAIASSASVTRNDVPQRGHCVIRASINLHYPCGVA